MKLSYLIIALLIVTNGNAQKFANLALTPPMGWNSWNTFQTNISEELVKDIADKMVSSGMKDAGYQYIVLDDGWMAKERDSITGDLVPDSIKFPHGMKALANYIHSKGLKFGLYNCAGTLTCAGYPGTRGYEYQDARFYASMQIDYLKFDWCNTDGITAKEAYTTMSKALKAAGRPIVFSLCEWGNNKPWEWATNVGELWRTTGDVYACFDCIHDWGTWKSNGVLQIVAMQKDLRNYAGPGHWNDPDMLEVGNGLSDVENKSHFSLWAMMAAPLIAGNDLSKMNTETNSVLINKDLIAIDQDSLGIQGFLYSTTDSVQLWFKPLQNNDWAVCFVNTGHTTKTITNTWKIIYDSLSNKTLNTINTIYKIKNLWTGKELGNTNKPIKEAVVSHDVLLLRLIRQ